MSPVPKLLIQAVRIHKLLDKSAVSKKLLLIYNQRKAIFKDNQDLFSIKQINPKYFIPTLPRHRGSFLHIYYIFMNLLFFFDPIGN